MTNVEVSWNYHDIDTTYEQMAQDDEATVLYVRGAPEYKEHIGLTTMQAECLIADIRRMLDELYAKEGAE